MGYARSNKALLQEIAAELRRLRKEHALSQIDVYIDTDIHVGRIEQGRTNISVTTLFDLCSYYGVSLEDFFAGIKYSEKK